MRRIQFFYQICLTTFFVVFALLHPRAESSAFAQGYIVAQEDNELEEALTEAEGSATEVPPEDDVGFEEFDDGESTAKTPDAPANTDSAGEKAAEEDANEVDQDIQPLEEAQPAQPVAPSEPVTPVDPVVESVPEELEPAPVVDSEPEPPAPVVESVPTQDSTPMQTFNDDPDLALEAQLHDIYLNFHSKPTSSEQWSAVLGERSSEIYQIQRGDTLWDISKTLFGDGNYWPKIWSINGKIKNPHLVEPGYQIRFIMGDETDAPAFTITEKNATDYQESNPAPAQPGTPMYETGASDTLTGMDIEIPPPLKPSRPVVMKLPPSLPYWQTQDRGKYNELGMEFVRRPVLDIKDVFQMTDYVVDRLPASFGKVMEIETGSEIAGAYQYIYIKASAGINPGDKYLAVQDRGQLKAANKFVDTDGASSLEIQGEIEITENVRSADDESVIYRALVLSSVNPISVGAVLIKGALKSISMDKNGPRSNVVSQIIGGEFDNRRQIFGRGNIVFLNRGARDGVGEGQIMPVRSNRQVRIPGTKLRQNNLPIGFLQIAKTEEDFATAIVISAWDDIRPGDFTGEGELLLKIDDANRMGSAPSGGRENPETENMEEDLDTLEE